MSRSKFPNYDSGDLPPESLEEREWKDGWEEEPVDPQAQLKAQLAEKIAKRSPEPVSEQKKPVAGNPVTKPVSTPVENPKPTACKSSSERKKRWRERHGEEARRKEREYLKSWRAKKK